MSKNVKIFTEVSDGAGDVESAWIDGTVVGEYSVSSSMRHSTGERPGIIVHAPRCAYKDKYIRVSDDLISTVIC